MSLGLKQIVYMEPYPDPAAKIILDNANVKSEFFEGVTSRGFFRVYGERKMNKCPKCKRWTLEFDEYFGRPRCLATDCGWMPPSRVQREMRRHFVYEEPITLAPVQVAGADEALMPHYDRPNDVVLGLLRQAQSSLEEEPDDDARIIWLRAANHATLAGFMVLDTAGMDQSEVTVESLCSHKNELEHGVLRGAKPKAEEKSQEPSARYAFGSGVPAISNIIKAVVQAFDMLRSADHSRPT